MAYPDHRARSPALTAPTPLDKSARKPRRMARQPSHADLTVVPAPAPAQAKLSQSELVLALLRREDGAILTEITQATGWLPHSARAALTGLRKKGHEIEKTRRGTVTCYFIAAAAA